MAASKFYSTVSPVVALIFMYLSADASVSRHRRDVTGYVIDTLVIVDTIVFNEWVSLEPKSKSLDERRRDATAKLKNYMSVVIHQANGRLWTLGIPDEDSFVQISIAQFIVNINPLALTPKKIGGGVISQLALKMLSTWVTNYSDTFDHVLLMTGEVLDDGRVRGRANIGTMCSKTGLSVSIVQEMGGYQSAFYVAHEIGHSLGSDHDGNGTSSDCKYTDRYIMAADLDAPLTSANTANPWHFSSCSFRSIRGFLSTNGASCLTSHQPAVTEFINSQSILPGLQDDADKQCQMIVGISSRLCLGGDFGSLDTVCTAMYCLNPSSINTPTTRCTKYQAVEGTVCANGKMCIEGRCVTDDRAPALMDDPGCPYGDSVTSVDDLPCSESVSRQPANCYDQNIHSLCCASCARVAAKSGSDACPYGDRKLGCAKEFCQNTMFESSDRKRYDRECCGTCSQDISPAQCTTVDVLSITMIIIINIYIALPI